MALAQACNQQLRITRKHAGLSGAEEVNSLAGHRGLIRKYFAERAADGAQKLGQIRTDSFFGRAQLRGKQPIGREVRARLAEELHRVEAVQLRCLRIGHVDHDHIEFFFGFGEESPAIEKMQMHARVGSKGRGLGGKIFLRHPDERRIKLHVIEALDGGMLEHLSDAAIDASSDEQNPARRSVLKERVVNGLLGRGRIGRVGEDGAIFAQATNSTRFVRASLGHRQVSIDGVALGNHIETAPEACARRGIAARSDPDEERNGSQRGRASEKRNPPSLHSKDQRRGHGEIEQAHDGRDLKGIEKTHQDDAGQYSSERGTRSLEQISCAGSSARREVQFSSNHARSRDEQSA